MLIIDFSIKRARIAFAFDSIFLDEHVHFWEFALYINDGVLGQRIYLSMNLSRTLSKSPSVN